MKFAEAIGLKREHTLYMLLYEHGDDRLWKKRPYLQNLQLHTLAFH